MENKKLKMNLQIFADGDDVGADPGNGAETGSEGTVASETQNTESQEPKSFDDLLKDSQYQAEFDRRVQKALETQRSKLEVLMNEKASEADKLAKMTKEEKERYQQQKKEKELADRESAITRRELMAEAKNALAEKNIPAVLAEVLNYSNADTCKESIAAVEKAFQSAVELAVQERLKGGTPPKKAPEGAQVTKEDFAKMTYQQKYEFKQKNPDEYREFLK